MILMCLRVNRILKEGKREGWLCKKLFQRLWPWVDTTWEWVDARTKESWQWDYLLAKKLFSDDVLTSCVRRLGSHHRRKPMSCVAHEASTREAALKPCIPSMRWFAGDSLGTDYLGSTTDLTHADHIPHQGGSCRVVDAACPGLLMVTFLSYSKIP